jgi:hypothetical protein
MQAHRHAALIIFHVRVCQNGSNEGKIASLQTLAPLSTCYAITPAQLSEGMCLEKIARQPGPSSQN